MEFRKVIAARRSSRAFADRPVEPEKIERMIEAARWSPSCANRQPWRYVVVERSAPSRPALEAALDPGNAWAKRAPVLVVAAARRADGSVVESRDYYLHDTGLAGRVQAAARHAQSVAGRLNADVGRQGFHVRSHFRSDSAGGD